MGYYYCSCNCLYYDMNYISGRGSIIEFIYFIALKDIFIKNQF